MSGEQQTNTATATSSDDPPPPYQDCSNSHGNYTSTAEKVILIQPVGTSPVLASNYRFRDVSAYVICQYCFATVTTATEYQSGCLAWTLGTTIFVLGGIWGCCFIPCCLPSCLDVVHICPNCGAVVGTYQRGFQ